MAATTFEPNTNLLKGIRSFRQRLTARGLWFGLILLAALVAFELFNFATTEYALDSLFGAQNALGVATWAKVLAIAFCGIDFAGLSRLFTPETGRKEPKEIWLLTGAWFLGAGMNAIMTWWAVGSALAANPLLGNEIMSRADILYYGPIFIAALVWLTRVLIIGTFAFAGDHIFSTARRAANGEVVAGSARRMQANSRSAAGSVRPAEPRAVPTRTQPRGLPERSAPVASSYNSSSSGSQRSFFGRGAGNSFQPSAYSEQASQPAAQAAPGPTSNTIPFSRPAAPAQERAQPAAFSRRKEAPASRNRASSTRTVNRSAAASYADPAPMELEYVDLE
jgi:hypothetical protein